MSNEQSLLLWDVPLSQGSLDDFLQPANKNVEHVQYMTFRLGQEKDGKNCVANWCHPLRIKVNQIVIMTRVNNILIDLFS